MIRIALTALLCLLTALPLRAGILADGTRIIYPAQRREKTLMLANTNRYPVIVQSWVDSGEGDPGTAHAPFVVLPAVFRLAPGERQAVRIIYNQDPLPQDRESVFWINLYEIPPDTQKQSDRSHVRLAINTQLKLFWRPEGVVARPQDIVDKLVFRLVYTYEGWAIECHNLTPLNISFTSIALVNSSGEQWVESQADMMTLAFNTRRYPLAGTGIKPFGQQVRFHYLDDRGVFREYVSFLKNSEN